MDTYDLTAAERVRLANEMDTFEPADWDAASLCDGWSNHVLLAHLNLPWGMGVPTIAVNLLKARGNLAKMMDRSSRDLAARLDPAACLALYREHAADRYSPPTLGPEAQLTDTIVHGLDLLTPVGRSVDQDPEALRQILAFLLSPAAKRGFRSIGVDGLAFAATDLDETFGTGAALVRGPATAIAGGMLGRRVFLDQLEGDGVAVLAARL